MKLDKNLVGERIVVRSYEAFDKEFCTKMWFDAENGKYLSDPTEEYVDECFMEAVNTLQDSEDGYYLVIERKEDGKRLGTCGAFPEGEDAIDIGYCVKMDYWRNGYGFEALNLLIDWAKEKGFKKVTAEVAKENAASCGLLTKLGFKPVKDTAFKKYRMDIKYDSYVFERHIA